jgi:hypothetical protein
MPPLTTRHLLERFEFAQLLSHVNAPTPQMQPSHLIQYDAEEARAAQEETKVYPDGLAWNGKVPVGAATGLTHE